MFKHKRRNEGALYEAPNNRNKINDDVREELAGTETFLTDTQGLIKACLRKSRRDLSKWFYFIHSRN